MERFSGATLSSVASALLVLVVLGAYLAESARDVSLYYSYVTVSPVLAAVIAVGVIAVFAGVRAGLLSETVGTGIALGFGLVMLGVVTIWAVTGRVDVFLARGWAFPAQRWVLVGLAVLVVFGAVLQGSRLGQSPVRRGDTS